MRAIFEYGAQPDRVFPRFATRRRYRTRRDVNHGEYFTPRNIGPISRERPRFIAWKMKGNSRLILWKNNQENIGTATGDMLKSISFECCQRRPMRGIYYFSKQIFE
jgi:hypothetical protein